jgi:adenosine kinase
MKKALCVGSVAFDFVMEIFPAIRDEIPLKDGKIEALNLALVSPKNPQIRRGGTAGNISFGIGFLGAPAILFSAVGHDFKINYSKDLEAIGVESKVQIYEEELTAHAYLITDPNKEQIIIWQPNSASHIEDISLTQIKETINEEVAVAIFSPGSASSTLKHLKELKSINKDIKAIFDPGQMVNTYSVEQFVEALHLSDLVIMNEAEVLKARSRGLKVESLNKDYPHLILIETCAGAGANYYMPNGEKWHVGVVPKSNLIEPTGAGDTFRSGLIYGYLNGKSWVDAGKYGAAVASACISSSGAQEFSKTFSRQEVLKNVELVKITKRERINCILIILINNRN